MFYFIFIIAFIINSSSTNRKVVARNEARQLHLGIKAFEKPGIQVKPLDKAFDIPLANIEMPRVTKSLRLADPSHPVALYPPRTDDNIQEVIDDPSGLGAPGGDQFGDSNGLGVSHSQPGDVPGK
jgi:hypothetical protein